MNAHIPNAVTSRGIDVREQINQGFVRSELGTTADDKATRIYDGAEINPTLLKRHAMSAVENYMAAISCFLRAIPSVKDVRSKRLLQEHVNRLLLRLEGMRALAREADRLIGLNGGNPVTLQPWEKINYIPTEFDPRSLRDHFDEDLAEAFDMLTADLAEEEPFDRSSMFSVGTEVEVMAKSGTWKPATINGYDRDKYNVSFKDGTEEIAVDQSRVRLPQPKVIERIEPSPQLQEEHQRRMEVMSEIVESERKYNMDLKNLFDHYIHPLRNPAHWGGQRESNETWFSQKTLDPEEAQKLFADMEEIIAMNKEFLRSMEESFSRMETDQSLASDFVKFAPKFKIYTKYVTQFEESQAMIAKMRKERMGFQSADQAAQANQIPPLADLMKLPLARIDAYIDQLRKLESRTPPNHPSFPDMNLALELFRSVQEYMKEAVHMKENQEIVRQIQEKFSPVLPLVHPTRVFLFEGSLQRMEEGNAKKRIFWLFNDILVCGRTSEWLSRGSYRHLGSLTIKGFGSSDEFGPLALYVKGSSARWTMVCPDLGTKAEWMRKLALCPAAVNESRRINIPVANIIQSPKSIYSPVHQFGPNSPSNQNVSSPSHLAMQSPTYHGAYSPASASATEAFGRMSLGGTGPYSPSQPPPPPPPPPPSLPPGWVELVDQKSGKTYYYCKDLQKTQWEKPI